MSDTIHGQTASTAAELAAIKTTLGGVTSKLSEISDDLKQLADLDKRMAEMLVDQRNRAAEIGAIWSRLQAVEQVSKEAAAHGSAVTNQLIGFKLGVGVVAGGLGVLVTAAILWMFSTVQQMNSQVAVLQDRARMEGVRHGEKP